MNSPAHLADYDVTLDPDFDAGMEELEREFAELRISLSQGE